MSTLPTFSFSCIAADNAGNPVLFGVNSGRLEAHAIDLTNALAPTSTLISATSTPSGWDAQSNLGCYSYAGNAPSPSYPINILQFGATNNLQVQFYPNGTWVSPVETTTASTLNYQSPKLFSLVGSTNGWNWFVARTTSTGGTASWRGVRAGARIDAGPQDLMPGSEPLFTVGAIAQDIANFGNGFLFSFDQSGSAGTAYQAVGNKKLDRNLTSTESLLNLTKVNAVNMNSLVVTQDAIPLASGFSAFVVDKSPAGLISVMSIDPRSFNYKLVQSPVTGPSPVFLSGQSAASVSSKIIVYGGTSPSGPSNNIHSFDIISGTWSGPALADAPNGNGAKSGLSPAIIGGAVAGVLVLLAVLGLFVYRRRRSTKLLPLKLGTLSGTEDRDNKQAMINMMNMEDKSTNAPLVRNSSSPQSTKHQTRSNATLRTVDPAAKTYPYSQHRSSRHSVVQHSSKPKSHHVPSRQASSYSVYSDGSASHISLFPVQSGIYLVDSPSLMPPTPVVPSAYTTGAIKYPQHTYQSPPSVPQSPSRKVSVYKVAVPDDYDDRQPLHRQGTADENPYQPTVASRSSTDSPRGSWSGQSDNRPVQHADTTQRSHQRDGSSSERTHRSRRPSHSASSTSHSVPTSPAASNADISPTSPTNASRSHRRTHSSSSKTRRKKTATSTPRMPSSDGVPQSVATLSPPSPGFNRSEYRDSGSYKVEYRDSGSSSSPATAVLATASTPPMPTPRNRRKVPSPAVAESDTIFTNVFPLPPARSGGPNHGQSSPISLQDLSPMPYKMNREQQKLWQERQMELLQEQRQQRQHQQSPEEERQLDPQYQHQLKTPKLASLPRPVIRN
ncbi:hypothetical protein MVEG_02147 [Podila verticillata NRRL 6337]|nr:hypothetical protein MVEG_02147 [Podila verticillata NRRL 6337]